MRADVLVIGSGLAGCMAAISAADAGASVTLASYGPLFSGSSFYKGTWGLGMIAPVDAQDEKDLAATILEVGCGCVRPEMVSAFVSGIKPAIKRLESLGVTLRRADKADQREYIACFDHKHRDWYGLEREPYIKVMRERIEERGITVLPRHELLGLSNAPDGSICGATLFDHAEGQFLRLPCQSVVLACGGATGLFSRNLSPVDCLSTAQAIACEAGAQLENFEFIQFMPGMVSPRKGIVFNEKAFRFCSSPSLADAEHLDQRSTYGPFTCRLKSNAVDLAIARCGDEGLPITLGTEEEPLPEFVETYCSWLEESFGVDRHETIRIAHYAHASNGGIRIDANAATDVPGLFAAGEATGGMHGADRLGGLSSANCLVFGLKAGESAAAWAKTHAASEEPMEAVWMGAAYDDCRFVEQELTRAVDRACSVERRGEVIQKALKKVKDLGAILTEKSVPCTDPTLVAMTRRTTLRAKSAHALMEAISMRKESLGSHFRCS